MSAESPGGDQQRTELAVERTMLAWWRTGLAALAVALAVGRLLPDLSPETPAWPYVLLGLGFNFFGTGLIVYGTLESGEATGLPVGRLIATAFATVLALGTMALIAIR